MNYFEALIDLLGIITLSGGGTLGVLVLMKKLEQRTKKHREKQIKEIVLEYLKELQK